jgi:hypothetical protein
MNALYCFLVAAATLCLNHWVRLILRGRDAKGRL